MQDKEGSKQKSSDNVKGSPGFAEVVNFFELGRLGSTIIQSLPIGVVTFDADLKVIEANPQAKKIIEISKSIDNSLSAGTEGRGITTANWTEQITTTLSEGEITTFNNISYTSNEKTRLLRITCAPIKQADSAKILGGYLVIEDITEKVHLQKELAGAERLATIGKLVCEVAHELNNPLDGILRYINLTTRIVEQENLEKPREYLNRCREGLMRMVQIVSELLEFSRGSHKPLEYVQIEQIIEDAIKTIEAKSEVSNVKVYRNYTSGIPRVRGGNLFQVFCNLIKNAYEAMPGGGQLQIWTYTSSGNVTVEFRDTGGGFPSEKAEMLFEPFFTTKEKGTGLGLAICRDIVERYNGWITAANAAEGGSIFTVYLPVEDKR
jgi:signal transduction histidine kinase